MPSNPDQQPWAPDADVAPGTPPVNGTGGERGTSAFDGSTLFDYHGAPIGTNPGYGPRLGKDYAVANGTDTITTITRGITANQYERAGTHAAVTPTVTLTSSNNSPAANASVTLTATLTGTQSWPKSGTVSFKEGATVLGTGTVNSSGVATFVKSSGFAAGAHTLTAVFGGTSDLATATSPGLVVTAA